MQKPTCRAGRSARSATASAAKGFGKLALHGAFPCLLQDRVRGKVGVDGHRRLMRRDHIGPARRDPVLVLFEKRLFPQKPDGQEVGERVVRPPRKLRLPEMVAPDLAPAAQREQKLVEIGLERRLGQAQRVERPAFRFVGGVRGFAHILREALETGDFRGQVVGGELPPRVIGAAPARGGPERLALVEIARRPKAEAVGDDAGPIEPRDLRRQIRHGRLRRGGGRLGSGQPLDRLEVEPLRVGTGGDGVEDILIGDRALADEARVMGARHRHRHTCNAAESCAGLGQRFARLSEIGVHRHRGGQRPDRGNGARGGVAGLGDLRQGKRRWVGHRCHSSASVQDGRVTDQPRKSLSNTALM